MAEAHISGSYDAEGVIWHQHSNRLLIKIIEYFPKEKPVLDLGCGHNFYASAMNYMGYRAAGIDMVDLGSKYFMKGDLTLPIPVAGENFNVISLEVGEHIPHEKSETYLSNVTSFKGDIIMSWAVPGQAGVGHVNCQSNEWVIEKMKNRGYVLDENKTASLREAVKDCHCSWFRNTLMYFYAN